MKLKNIFLVSLLAIVVTADIAPFIPKSQVLSIQYEKYNDERISQDKWWQTASFYQIYPRSFKDSDGDGVGDLKGITEKLPYLKEIGITATWLSPIFPSPMADFGYDISNFTDIEPIFGNMDDFDALMKKANEVGIKVIMDFVPNHTSDESIWFQKSVVRDPEYENFYVWHPGKMVNGKKQPPSNWMSAFRGNAWEWNEQRQEYYYHQFVTKQPDLNYRNTKVKEYMNEVLKFWLRKGVAGFRCDAVPNVFEIAPDANGNYPDEPRNSSVNDPDAYNYVQHIYTSDQPETVQLVYEWRQLLDDFKIENGGEDRILMIESYSPIENVMEYYGNKTHEGAQIPFNFQMITYLKNHSDAYYYSEIINLWMNKMPEGKTANWVLGNHDRSRVGSRMGTDRIDMLHMLTLTLPGSCVTYQGEETGMTDVWMSWNDTVDPQACNSNPDIYEPLSRDACRSPFQWNDEKNAGFSNGSKTWLPISDLYELVNVKSERVVPFSHLNIYKQLQSLRTERTLKLGDTEVKAVSDTVLALKRSLLDDYIYITLANIMDNVEIVNLNSVFKSVPQDLEYVVVTDRSQRRKGDKTYSDQIIMLPKEAVVLYGQQQKLH